MQREIEALLSAYLMERTKEAQVVQELLTALAVGASGRQRMMQELAAAVGATQASQPSVAMAPDLDIQTQTSLTAEVSAAIAQLRAARTATAH